MMPIKHILVALLITVCFVAGSCKIANCDKLPKHFESYDKAISQIKSSHFNIAETVDTDKSSWITSASYYSCDGLSGFFILGTTTKEYVHSNLPVKVWEEFKKADSYGRYYDENIRHRYHFYLNQ
jgi:hypothetical protein